MMSRLLGAAVLAGILSSPLAAQVTIQVVDPNGRPVPAVEISVLVRGELIGATSSFRGDPPRSPGGVPSYAWVVFGSDTIRAEIARTDEERERGLMFRESVPDGTGMLFVFPQAEIQGVWMKDTYVPLDVAFLDAQSRILSIEQLEPLDLTPKWSQGPVMFALEVRQGWFADHRISVGDRAEIVFGVR